MEKYRGFIPNSFYEKQAKGRETQEKKIICLCILVNLILIPFSFNALKSSNEKQSTASVSVKEQTKQNSMNIYGAAQEILNSSLDSIYIENGKGEAVLDDINDIKKINEKVFEIKTAVLKEDGYKAGISLNEK